MESQLAAAMARHRAGDLAGAEAEYRRILAAAPHLLAGHNALGAALMQTGRAPEAEQNFRRALSLDPAHIGAQANLGAALMAQGRPSDALEALEAALRLDPGHQDAQYNSGCVLQAMGRLDEALERYDRLLAAHPGHAGAWNNTALAQRALGRLTESLTAYERAVALAPSNAVIRYGYAQALLENGDFQRGWTEHEWRFAAGIAAERHQSLPRWPGGEAKGRTILVWAEQGFGDSIQFCRHAPLLAQLGARVALEVPEPLERLFRSLAGVEIVTRGQPLPACDAQIPLMSLPLALGPEPFFPGPYLKPDQKDVEIWGRRLGPKTGRRIGLAWAGSPTHRDDFNRSIPPDLLGPLAQAAPGELYSFQIGDKAPCPPGIRPLPGEPADFADTAAAMSHMDLVIAVDTSTLHLAGAMGLPAWGLLPFAPDWRWLRDGEDSPWHPSVRLFRQRSRGDWAEVLRRVAAELG